MERTKQRVQLSKAIEPFVLALDVGSTASRGDVYDAAGRPVEGGRHKVPHQFRTAGDGTSEIDPDAVVEELAHIIDGLATAKLQGRIGGVALDTFASSLVGVSADGSAVTPCYTYADTRCAPQAMALRRESTRPRFTNEPAVACTRAIWRRGCGGCERRNRTSSRRQLGGCRWASMHT
jgi:gluconokinase